MITDISKAQIIHLPKFLDPRGNLSFLESENHIPFKMKRAYWIYDVPGGEYRGGHAYHELMEVIIALSGSFEVLIDDGYEEKIYPLNRSYYGLYVPKGKWRMLQNFSTNSLALILASEVYNEADYVRDYDKFKQLVHGKS